MTKFKEGDRRRTKYRLSILKKKLLKILLIIF